MDLKWLFLGSSVGLLGCATARPPSGAPDLTLPGSDGRAHRLVDEHAKLTVIEFFSVHCPCQAKHDARLRVLAEEYGRRGVTIVAVDSEVGANPLRGREEAERRQYPFPILSDPDGLVANALDASYATYSVVIDRQGRIIYAGGIDSDKNHLTNDATPFLRDALDDALAEKPLRRPLGKTLGCALTLK